MENSTQEQLSKTKNQTLMQTTTYLLRPRINLSTHPSPFHLPNTHSKLYLVYTHSIVHYNYQLHCLFSQNPMHPTYPSTCPLKSGAVLSFLTIFP